MKFLTFLFFFFLVLWFVGLILRATFSRWLRRRAAEFNKAAQAAQKEARTRGRKEGEITVENTRPAEEKKVSRQAGEYVDFEEITVREEK
jgi:short subunit dehydrogenase-like uncharacterized protein